MSIWFWKSVRRLILCDESIYRAITNRFSVKWKATNHGSMTLAFSGDPFWNHEKHNFWSMLYSKAHWMGTKSNTQSSSLRLICCATNSCFFLSNYVYIRKTLQSDWLVLGTWIIHIFPYRRQREFIRLSLQLKNTCFSGKWTRTYWLRVAKS